MSASFGECLFAAVSNVCAGQVVESGTRTAPAERANVREFRGLTTGKEWLT